MATSLLPIAAAPVPPGAAARASSSGGGATEFEAALSAATRADGARADVPARPGTAERGPQARNDAAAENGRQKPARASLETRHATRSSSSAVEGPGAASEDEEWGGEAAPARRGDRDDSGAVVVAHELQPEPVRAPLADELELDAAADPSLELMEHLAAPFAAGSASGRQSAPSRLDSAADHMKAQSGTEGWRDLLDQHVAASQAGVPEASSPSTGGQASVTPIARTTIETPEHAAPAQAGVSAAPQITADIAARVQPMAEAGVTSDSPQAATTRGQAATDAAEARSSGAANVQRATPQPRDVTDGRETAYALLNAAMQASAQAVKTPDRAAVQTPALGGLQQQAMPHVGVRPIDTAPANEDSIEIAVTEAVERVQSHVTISRALQHETGSGSQFGHRDAETGSRATAAPPSTTHAALASALCPGQDAFGAALGRATAPGLANTQSFATTELTAVGPQLIRQLHVQVKAGGGEMTMTLAPEHLGNVTIRLRVEDNRVFATLAAETPAVRGWIAAHEPDLKSGLAELGLQLDELVVREDGSRRQSDGREDAPRQQPRRRREVMEETFEIRV